MKLYSKQMCSYNCYALYAENVEPEYHDYFRGELWWQLGDGFIKTYDNVEGMAYCAENFNKYGYESIGQRLKISSCPWQGALKEFIPEMKKTGADWYIHGSTAMALWGIDVIPRNINVCVPNYDDFDRVKNHFMRLAVQPFQRCENWVASDLGSIFLKANIGFSFGNRANERFNLQSLKKCGFGGEEIYISTLEMLREDNIGYNRPERVKLIEEKMQEYKI